MKQKLKRHYSGKASLEFWNSVSKLRRGKGRAEIYELGCILQNLEVVVLAKLIGAWNRRKP